MTPKTKFPTPEIVETGELFRQPPLESPAVRFRDLRVTDDSLRQRLIDAVEQVLVSGRLLMGPKVEAFEARLAEFCGRTKCVGLSSGTDAVYLALRGLHIGPGDEVITTPMSWVATLNAIVMAGATPVFADIDRDQNINPDNIAAAITSKTKAILPVHFTGRLCNMDAILQIARRHGLLVVEDAAQAMGARDGAFKAGSHGDAAAFSLNPMKVFPGYGEAGAVVTDDAGLDERIRELRYLGTRQKEVCIEPALNAKMDEIQAAMMLTSFDILQDLIDTRIALASAYSERLDGVVTCPPIPAANDYNSNFFDYQIFSPERDRLRAGLADRGIETKVKHPLLLPDHPAYENLDRPDLPIADEIVATMLSLPLHEKMTLQDVELVCDAVRDIVIPS